MANPKGMNRKEFSEKDFENIENLAKIQCTQKEICGFMKVAEETLNARIREHYNLTYSEWFDLYSQEGRISLRRKQFEVARNGNVNMLIWLGKQMLSQKDKIQEEVIKFDNKETIDLIEKTFNE